MKKFISLFLALMAMIGTMSASDIARIKALVESSKQVKLSSWNLILNGNERFHFVTDSQENIYLTVSYRRESSAKPVFSHIAIGAEKSDHNSFRLDELKNKNNLKILIAALEKDEDIDEVDRKRIKSLLAHFE